MTRRAADLPCRTHWSVPGPRRSSSPACLPIRPPRPHLWRQYLDLLLRAEQIARVTGEVPAGVINRLTLLERDLALPPWKAEPSCIPFSLPAGRALGYPRPTISGDDFNAIWAEEDGKRNDAWSARAQRLEAESTPLAVRLAGRKPCSITSRLVSGRTSRRSIGPRGFSSTLTSASRGRWKRTSAHTSEASDHGE